MRKKRIAFVLMGISLLVLLCSHTYCVFFYSRQPAAVSKYVQKGVPYVFQSNEDYYGEIQKLRITDDYVYVLFGGKAIVKVYRHDGAYIGTIAVYDDTGYGGTWMNTDHHRAYIEGLCAKSGLFHRKLKKPWRASNSAMAFSIFKNFVSDRIFHRIPSGNPGSDLLKWPAGFPPSSSAGSAGYGSRPAVLR